jgi:hypothetical protein
MIIHVVDNIVIRRVDPINWAVSKFKAARFDDKTQKEVAERFDDYGFYTSLEHAYDSLPKSCSTKTESFKELTELVAKLIEFRKIPVKII